jgi:histidyl-tRNA synthetase
VARQQFQTLRGMHDLLPEQAAQYVALTGEFSKVATDAGFGRIETPLLEDAGLFARGIGTETDTVSKEMYAFKDRSDNEVALRPEFTAGIVRAFIENGMNSWPQPVKLYSYGPLFRYDRPQSGRQRQFNQVNVEVFGEAAPSIDAQTIVLAQRFFKRVRLSNVSLQLNSIGDQSCRPKYRKALVEYLETHSKKLAAVDRERVASNPLRVLDSKEPSTQTVLANAPQTLNFLCEACQKHFEGLLEYLDELGVTYELNPLLDGGVSAVGAVDRDGIGAQLARADKLGVPFAIIIGQKEVREETVILRDMASGAQEILPLPSLVAELRTRFGVA